MPHLHNVLLKSGYHLLGSPFLFKNICFDFQHVINKSEKIFASYYVYVFTLYSPKRNKNI